VQYGVSNDDVRRHAWSTDRTQTLFNIIEYAHRADHCRAGRGYDAKSVEEEKTVSAMNVASNESVMRMRKETDGLGEVDVPSAKLWGAQTQGSLEYFSIGQDLIPREMIAAYATLNKAAANANHAGGQLDDERHRLIVQACDEILAGRHEDMFPLHVWMTGSGTQFNMNVNEVISNRCCHLAGTPLGSKTPAHPNDHANMSQSSNDSFPTAMNIAAAVNVKERLIPAVKALRDAIVANADEWKDIVKIGRTHMQDATPLTLDEE
jgi:fumarate hydratase class II